MLNFNRLWCLLKKVGTFLKFEIFSLYTWACETEKQIY